MGRDQNFKRPTESNVEEFNRRIIVECTAVVQNCPQFVWGYCISQGLLQKIKCL